jgi:UDP-4-amino-4,6-dideoxy-N-acetyl-beta-L-altrosamine N-acetyltransferase
MKIEFENILKVDKKLIEKVRQWRNNEQVSKYMYTNHFITNEEHQKWIEKLQKNKTSKVWIIKYESKPVGIVSLSKIDNINKMTEWGFYIAEQFVKDKGIGSAVLFQLIEHVFYTLNLEKMKTLVLANNQIALKMYKKFGFKKIQIKDKIQRDDKTINIFIMELNKKDWDPFTYKPKKTIMINNEGLIT